jgi:hypothetical protein
LQGARDIERINTDAAAGRVYIPKWSEIRARLDSIARVFDVQRSQTYQTK